VLVLGSELRGVQGARLEDELNFRTEGEEEQRKDWNPSLRSLGNQNEVNRKIEENDTKSSKTGNYG
jgi:hypothetical protein